MGSFQKFMKNGNGEKIRTTLFSEIKLIWVIVVAAVGLSAWIFNDQFQQNLKVVQLNDAVVNIQQTVNTIKSNDLAHIDVKLDTLSTQIQTLHDDVVRLQVQLQK